MRISNQIGEVIVSVDDWFLKAPPKKGALQWKDYRSAKELAKAWFRSPIASPPQELTRFLLESFPLEEVILTEAHPEYVVRLDNFRGEHRNADLILLGSVGSKRLLISIEAKADEAFGDQPVGEYFDSRSGVPRSKVPSRIRNLARALFDSDLDAEIRMLSTSLQKFANVFLQRSQAAACWVAGNLESKAARSLRVNFHAKGLAVASQ